MDSLRGVDLQHGIQVNTTHGQSLISWMAGPSLFGSGLFVTRLMVSNGSFFDPFKSLGKPNSQPMDWIHLDFGVDVELAWHFPMCVALIWVAPKP